MKYLLLIFLPIFSFTQDKFKIEYERRHFIKLDGNSENYRLMEEQFSIPVYIELLVNKNECSSKEIEKLTNQQGAKVQMQVLGMEKDLETYLDFLNNTSLVSKQLENKLFLISSTLIPENWITTRELKKIKGYQAKKATLEKNGFSYEVWFSTDIKSKCGPEEAIGLPGLVLEFTRTHIEKPENYTTYQLIDLTLDNTLSFNKPTKGKPFTEKEYQVFREEFDKKLKESITIGVDKN